MAHDLVLAALADPTRRTIFERILAEPGPVNRIAAGLPVSRPAVSQHLKALKDAGLATETRDGTSHIYAARRDGLAELIAWLEDAARGETALPKAASGGRAVKPKRIRKPAAAPRPATTAPPPAADAARSDAGGPAAVVYGLASTLQPAAAFDLFVDGIGRWWPLDTFSRAVELEGLGAASCVIEPRTGGAVYETSISGQRSDWARVTAFEPGRRVEFAWTMGRAPDRATRLEVAFESAPEGCGIRLTHDGWDALGAEAERARRDYSAVWRLVFASAFARAGRARLSN